MDVYRTLAQKLDALPNGFPATQSGVELRVLAKLFAPHEAALAAIMTAHPEPVAEIAARAGLEATEAARTLEGMAERGLVARQRVKDEWRYHLRPFVVGFFESQLPRLDVELAALVEAYYIETGGAFAPDAPPVHRTVPIGEVVTEGLDVAPFESATALIESSLSWAVQDCICRKGQHLLGKGCDRPVQNCLAFAPVEGVFTNDGTLRVITKDEALAILREADEAGLVHTVGNYRRGVHYICNCCTCCCGVLRRVAENGRPSAVARSAFRAQVDETLCAACGTCIERCQFGALSLGDVTVVDAVRCIGCGLCVSACPTEALRLVRRPEEEIEPMPTTARAWSREAALRRGLTPMDE